MLQEPHPFFTIGHSTRPFATFVDLLRGEGIRLVVDVRTVPRSRRNPQYNGDALAESLAPYDIAREHIAALGGLRGRQSGVPPNINGFWKNNSFHNYADYAMSGEFRAGLARLCDLGRATPCAIMCAEALWWQCHRRIIADYLLVEGETVFHILVPEHIEPALMTPAAKLESDRTLIYPAGSSRSDVA